MYLTFSGWFLAISSTAMLLVVLRSRGMGGAQLDLEACKACFEDIGSRIKNGEINGSEADAARLAFLSHALPARRSEGNIFQDIPQKALAVVAGFLLVAGLGAGIFMVRIAPEAKVSGEATSWSEPDEEMFSSLSDYARTIGTVQPSPVTPVAEMLPDVNSMIERLAARLESTPQDIEGWRLLGWSYFRTARYEQAASAFGKALELDPSSSDLKLSYQEAKAKASGSTSLETALPLDDGAADGEVAEPSGANVTQPGAKPVPESEAAIRSMVDGLAHRLESSPRDVDGWIHLMRSRVVLGESVVALTALNKALEVFADDTAAASKIKAAAIELGLKTK